MNAVTKADVQNIIRETLRESRPNMAALEDRVAKKIGWMWKIAVGVVLVAGAIIGGTRAWDSKADSEVIEELRAGHRRLQDADVANRMLLIDSIDMMSEKFLMAHPQVQSVKEPPSLQKARDSVRMARTHKELFKTGATK